MKVSKEKLRTGLVIAGMAIVTAVVIILYSVFMQTRIFNESASHLSEIYSQTDAFFQGRISSHRNIMRSWEPYIKSTVNNDDPKKSTEFENFVDEQRTALNFTRFSFIQIGKNGSMVAKDRDGREYSLNLNQSADDVFGTDDAGVACRRIYRYGTGIEVKDKDGNVIAPEGDKRDDYDLDDRFIMIGVPFSNDEENPNYYVAPGEKDDNKFYYDGIAFFFNVEAISYVLSVDAFEGRGSTFLVLPEGVNDASRGLVLLQSTADNTLFTYGFDRQWNFLDFLRDKTKMSNSAVEKLHKQWLEWIALKAETAATPELEAEVANTASTAYSDTMLFRANNGKQYYLNYRLVGYSDWIMIGVVPAEVLNASMTSLRAITIGVMAAIFVVLGSGVAWFIIVTNKRKMRDQALVIKSREKLFDLLTFNSNDIFALFDTKTGEAEYVSKNVETVLGLDLDSIKSNVYTLLSSAVQNVQDFAKQSATDFGDGVVIEELLMKNEKDQAEYWFRLGINPAESKDGSKYVLMLSDRTKERQLRNDLEAALAIAKSANEAKSNFLSNMSHDIRTPMNAIIGFATLLEKDVENPVKVREYIRKISFSSRHLLSLINDILDMSKIESGKSALHIEEFSLPEMLEELYSIIITQVQSKKQKFEMHTKGTIPELVNGDKLRLNQVMINLLSNAVKYTPVAGEIDLTVEALPESVRNHAHLRFTVKDNGLGMSEDFVKVIFEPFSRETTAYTKEIQGTGLGMAITKQIVDLMGGTITVKSKLGVGSEFIVEIELAKATQNYSDSTEFWKEHNIARMLVVDDEEDVCIEVKELMSDTGVVVDYSTSGEKALERLAEMKEGRIKYDIVILDWKMAGMDGLETAKRIRELIHTDLPIMVLTSYNFEDIAAEAETSDIHIFLSKPFFVSNFRNAVARLHDEKIETEEENEPRDDFSMSGLNILAAEDNPINAEILEELLSDEGAKCTIVENGKLAVEEFERSAPGTYDMIFMDVQMPVMNGHDASKAIRASAHPDAKKIPIIAMTANAFDDDKKMAYDAGMNAHVAKPIDMDVLKKTVAKLHGGHNE